MKKMKTQEVADWFQSQGMPQAAAQFRDLFDELEYVDYPGIRGFLELIYGDEDASYIMTKIRLDVPTSLISSLATQD